jgi:glycerate kinase
LGKVTDLLEQESFDYIITGEGKLDAQTLNGKLIAGVVRLGKQFNIPVLAVCGVSELDENGVKKLGLQSVISVADPNQNLEYNLAHTKDLIEKKIKMYFSN